MARLVGRRGSLSLSERHTGLFHTFRIGHVAAAGSACAEHSRGPAKRVIPCFYLFLAVFLHGGLWLTHSIPMKRHAFKMKLKPGALAEYEKRHARIWPELAAELKAAGIADYSIFFDPESLTLFAVQKVGDEAAAAALPQSSVVRKWWDYMAPLMETYPDHAPITGPLREVFHLD